MKTLQVNVYEAKTQLSALIEDTLSGTDVVIARAGKPAVRLVKWEPSPTRAPGIWKDRITIRDDFDEFSEQDELDWYGR